MQSGTPMAETNIQKDRQKIVMVGPYLVAWLRQLRKFQSVTQRCAIRKPKTPFLLSFSLFFFLPSPSTRKLHLLLFLLLTQILTKYSQLFTKSFNSSNPKPFPTSDSLKIPQFLPIHPFSPSKILTCITELALKTKEEVQKLLDAEFISFTHYPQWVANW